MNNESKTDNTTFSVDVDTETYNKCVEICENSGISIDEVVCGFVRFCSNLENKNTVLKWYAEYLAEEEKRNGSINFDILPHFTSDKLKNNFESICEKARSGCNPIVIEHSGKNYLLFDWSDYMKRFGALYSKEQINEINEACKNFKEE